MDASKCHPTCDGQACRWEPTGSMPRSVEPMWAGIDSLDLSPIKMKLCLPTPEGNGWTSEYADYAIDWYKRFLKITAKYPTHRNVPNGIIDEVWHKHILDTRKYATDCFTIFGHMLHHYPYFGLNGDSDQRDAAYDVSNDLYFAEFGERAREMTAMYHAGNPSPDEDTHPPDQNPVDGPMRGAMCDGDGVSCFTRTPLDALKAAICDGAGGHNCHAGHAENCYGTPGGGCDGDCQPTRDYSRTFYVGDGNFVSAMTAEFHRF